MDKQEMQRMMHEKMKQMCADMPSDQKTEMMMGMMDKMKDHIDMDAMMSKLHGDDGCGGPGGMQAMMEKMMQGGDDEHGGDAPMAEMMLTAMMPHCIAMMMPKVSQEKRAEIAAGLVKAVIEQATGGMAAEDKAAFLAGLGRSLEA